MSSSPPVSPLAGVTADPTRPLRLAPVVLGTSWSLLLVLLILVGPSGAAGASGEPQGPDPVGVWPLQPEPAVVEGFDAPDSPYGAGHRGVDLGGSPGQTVHAALPGRVSFAGSLAGRGVVVISHGTTRTTYEPVAATVSVGDVVVAGESIGTLQLPGSHCFPRACLHWGWIEGASTYLDPLRLVGSGPVRLLPLWRDLPAGGPPAPTAGRVPGPGGISEPVRRLFDLFGA